MTPDIWELFRVADFAERGSWPEDGGTLSQTIACVDGVHAVLNEKAMWKARMMREANER